MGTISNAASIYGLSATGSTTGTNVSGSLTLGQAQTSTTLTGADIFYSFAVTSTGASDVATLDLDAGSVAQTTGTPTITDGGGNDYEGDTLTTMVNVQSIMFVVSDVASGSVQIADSGNLIDCTISSDNGAAVLSLPAGEVITATNLVITFDAIGQDITVIVAGKSS